MIYREDSSEGNFWGLGNEMGQISWISGKRQWGLGVGQRKANRFEEKTYFKEIKKC